MTEANPIGALSAVFLISDGDICIAIATGAPPPRLMLTNPPIHIMGERWKEHEWRVLNRTPAKDRDELHVVRLDKTIVIEELLRIFKAISCFVIFSFLGRITKWLLFDCRRFHYLGNVSRGYTIHSGNKSGEYSYHLTDKLFRCSDNPPAKQPDLRPLRRLPIFTRWNSC